MATLSWRQAIGWHVRQHRLDARCAPGGTLEVAGEHGGLHAQLMSSAELIAWSRVEGVREGDVTQKLCADRALIKTWAMRHTLHLIRASDYWNWVSAAGSLPFYTAPTWLRYFGIDGEDAARIAEAAGHALAGPPLTRSELARQVAVLTGIPRYENLLLQGWGTLLKPASALGCICFAVDGAKTVRFTHPEVLLKRSRKLSAKAALAGVVRQFFRTYGPATVRELSRWLYLGAAKAEELVTALHEELEPVDVAGEQRAWMAAGTAAEAKNADPGRSVRLLAAFDPYVFAASVASDRYLNGGDHKQIYKASAWYAPVVMAGGLFAGTWRLDRRAKQTAVTVESFRQPAAWVKRGVVEEVERLGAYLGRKTELRWQ